MGAPQRVGEVPKDADRGQGRSRGPTQDEHRHGTQAAVGPEPNLVHGAGRAHQSDVNRAAVERIGDIQFVVDAHDHFPVGDGKPVEGLEQPPDVGLADGFSPGQDGRAPKGQHPVSLQGGPGVGGGRELPLPHPGHPRPADPPRPRPPDAAETEDRDGAAVRRLHEHQEPRAPDPFQRHPVIGVRSQGVLGAVNFDNASRTVGKIKGQLARGVGAQDGPQSVKRFPLFGKSVRFPKRPQKWRREGFGREFAPSVRHGPTATPFQSLFRGRPKIGHSTSIAQHFRRVPNGVPPGRGRERKSNPGRSVEFKGRPVGARGRPLQKEDLFPGRRFAGRRPGVPKGKGPGGGNVENDGDPLERPDRRRRFLGGNRRRIPSGEIEHGPGESQPAGKFPVGFRHGGERVEIIRVDATFLFRRAAVTFETVGQNSLLGFDQDHGPPPGQPPGTNRLGLPGQGVRLDDEGASGAGRGEEHSVFAHRAHRKRNPRFGKRIDFPQKVPIGAIRVQEGPQKSV